MSTSNQLQGVYQRLLAEETAKLAEHLAKENPTLAYVHLLQKRIAKVDANLCIVSMQLNEQPNERIEVAMDYHRQRLANLERKQSLEVAEEHQKQQVFIKQFKGRLLVDQ